MANTNLTDINWSNITADRLQSLIVAAGVTSTGGGQDLFYQGISRGTPAHGLGDAGFNSIEYSPALNFMNANAGQI
jgi:hypothetical protein